MSLLDEVDASASVYAPARLVGWITLVVMLATVVYAIVMALRYWSFIGV